MYSVLFSSYTLGTRIFPTLRSESFFFEFWFISHLRWHQSHLTLAWLRVPQSKKPEFGRYWLQASHVQTERYEANKGK